MSIIRSRIWVTRFENWTNFSLLKHSEKIPLDNELLKRIETIGESR